MSHNPNNHTLLVGVNTEEHKLRIRVGEVVVTGDVQGVTHSCQRLADMVEGPDTDVVILASDDFYPPKNWDRWIIDTIEDPSAILVADGYYRNEAVTIPIMTMGCLKRLNRVIYHTSYVHNYSDQELYYNLLELDLLVDLRDKSPCFEHRNWANKKRRADEVDRPLMDSAKDDGINWNRRMKLTLQERLLR